MGKAGTTRVINLAAAALLGMLAIACEEGSATSCPEGTYAGQDGQCVSICAMCGPRTTCVDGVCVPADGGAGVECGTGTVRLGDECVPAAVPGANGSRFKILTRLKPAMTSNDPYPQDLDELGMVLLYKPRGLAPGPPEIRTMSFGNGTVVPDETGTYLLDSELTTDVQATVAEDRSFETEPFVFLFPIVTSEEIVHLAGTVVTCTLDAAGLIDPAATCTLDGGITREDAEGIYIEVVASTLADLLGEDHMNLDVDGDGAMDAWEFLATFTVEDAVVEDPMPL